LHGVRSEIGFERDAADRAVTGFEHYVAYGFGGASRDRVVVDAFAES
jgi:hypothetical protein